jgi:hypothetical protein
VLLVAGALAVAEEGVAHQSKPRFTQLWLSPERDDSAVGSLGVTNDQGAATQYRLVLLRRGKVSDTWNFTLADGQTWTRNVQLTSKYTITANLYRMPDLTQPYRYVNTETTVPGA